jgi:hypothetical protein
VNWWAVKLDEETARVPVDVEAMRPVTADVVNVASSTPVRDNAALSLRSTKGVESNCNVSLKENRVSESVPSVAIANAYVIVVKLVRREALQSVRVRDARVQRKSDEGAPTFDAVEKGVVDSRDSGS